jgi:hypothetical protein
MAINVNFNQLRGCDNFASNFKEIKINFQITPERPLALHTFSLSPKSLSIFAPARLSRKREHGEKESSTHTASARTDTGARRINQSLFTTIVDLALPHILPRLASRSDARRAYAVRNALRLRIIKKSFMTMFAVIAVIVGCERARKKGSDFFLSLSAVCGCVCCWRKVREFFSASFHSQRGERGVIEAAAAAAAKETEGIYLSLALMTLRFFIFI